MDNIQPLEVVGRAVGLAAEHLNCNVELYHAVVYRDKIANHNHNRF